MHIYIEFVFLVSNEMHLFIRIYSIHRINILSQLLNTKSLQYEHLCSNFFYKQKLSCLYYELRIVGSTMFSSFSFSFFKSRGLALIYHFVFGGSLKTAQITTQLNK